MDRRRFLQAAGLGAAALLYRPVASAAASSGDPWWPVVRQDLRRLREDVFWLLGHGVEFIRVVPGRQGGSPEEFASVGQPSGSREEMDGRHARVRHTFRKLSRRLAKRYDVELRRLDAYNGDHPTIRPKGVLELELRSLYRPETDLRKLRSVAGACPFVLLPGVRFLGTDRAFAEISDGLWRTQVKPLLDELSRLPLSEFGLLSIEGSPRDEKAIVVTHRTYCIPDPIKELAQ